MNPIIKVVAGKIAKNVAKKAVTKMSSRNELKRAEKGEKPNTGKAKQRIQKVQKLSKTVGDWGRRLEAMQNEPASKEWFEKYGAPKMKKKVVSKMSSHGELKKAERGEKAILNKIYPKIYNKKNVRRDGKKPPLQKYLD